MASRFSRPIYVAAMLCGLMGAVAAATAAEQLVFVPTNVVLKGPEARQQLLVMRSLNGMLLGELTNATFISSDPAVARIENRVALPVKNGTTTITARAGKRTATASITVEGMDQPFEWTFRNHVQPVLARNGCSAGACHGAAAGQNGFRLSLRGYDDEGDFIALTRAALGRRIVPSDPGRSLLVLKPAGTVPHKGGKRFEVDSLDYRVLTEWIAAGAPGPKTNDPRIVRIQLLPEQVVLQPGVAQQLLVRAEFTDGHVEDVTRWAKFTSANETVCQIDENGKATVVGYGEGAVTAWYLSCIDIATLTVPYTNKVAARVFARAPKRNFIDELVTEKLQALRLPPSPRSSDGEFLRRAFLDTIGVLPTAEETRQFITDRSANKRDEAIERLLSRPEFVDYWSYKWSDLLLVSSKKLKAPAMWSFYNWIRQNVAANTPWDQFVRQIITAQGSTLENGAGTFYALHDDPRTMAETTSQAFLGMSINCAKCHNHPMEKWTNKQYYQMANLFARVRAKSGPTEGDQVVFVAASGDLVQPLTGQPQRPAPLDGTTLEFEAPEDRRQHLAAWLVDPKNAYFSRAIVNRIWANFMGPGLVEAVDDMRMTNPASNEKLLAALAHFLAEQHFDLKALMRLILQSEAYQRTSQTLPGNADDKRFYSHCYPRRLMAEVLHDAIFQITGVPTQFTVDRRNANAGLGEKYPLGLRALQLPDTQTDSYFLKAFGRPDREKTCECERTAEPSVTQVLHLANGETINKKLAAKENRISQLLQDNASNSRIVDEAYLGALSRYPTTTEKEQILKLLDQAEAAQRRETIEDVYWAILSSKEFLFNH